MVRRSERKAELLPVREGVIPVRSRRHTPAHQTCDRRSIRGCEKLSHSRIDGRGYGTPGVRSHQFWFLTSFLLFIFAYFSYILPRCFEDFCFLCLRSEICKNAYVRAVLGCLLYSLFLARYFERPTSYACFYPKQRSQQTNLVCLSLLRGVVASSSDHLGLASTANPMPAYYLARRSCRTRGTRLSRADICKGSGGTWRVPSDAALALTRKHVTIMIRSAKHSRREF